MAPYDESPSIEMFRLTDCDKSATNQGRLPPIVVLSSFDFETVRSCPKISKNLSMNSFSSHWSTATTQISNTTKARSEKKLRRRKFLHFVEILLGIVKEKDDRKFRNAKAIVYNWERENNHGEIESFLESLRSSLKHAVGSRFWSEAKQRLSQAPSHTKTKWLSFGDTTDADTRASAAIAPVQYDDDDDEEEGYLRSPVMFESQTCANRNVTTNEMKEMRRRKKRLWMIIRILMQYLRKKHRHLYRKAHILVNECVREHRQGQQTQHRNSLSRSIEACLKNEFGSELWKRAEHFVSQAFVRRHKDRY